MRHQGLASVGFLFICAALMAACVGQPPDPPARVASAIVGDPADTDVFCTASRFEAGMCDVIVEYEDHAGGFDLYLPHRVVQWGVGELASETPPTVWERGLLPSEHGGGTDWTHRVWLYDFVQIWDRLCTGVTGTCGFHAEYKSASNPGQRLTFYYGRLGSGPRRFQAILFTGPDGYWPFPIRTYAVAYDFITGHYGITPRAHLLESFGGLANATAPPEYTTTASVGGPYHGHLYPYATPNPIWVFSVMIAPSIRFNTDWVAY